MPVSMKKLILSLVLAPVLHTLPCGAMDSDEDPAAGAAQPIPPASIPRHLVILTALKRLKKPMYDDTIWRILEDLSEIPDGLIEGIMDAAVRLTPPTCVA